MLRGDSLVCGTSTTGTGALTLAACPTPPGGIDFDVWARTTGIANAGAAGGFGNSAQLLVDYTIVEYTDATFQTAKSIEGGVGNLTLGGSAGIANCVLARTTLDFSGTSLNSQPASFTLGGTAVSIGTAANALVFCSPRANVALAGSRYWDTTAALGPGNALTGANGGNTLPTNGTLFYVPYFNIIGRFVTKAVLQVSATYTGQNNNAYVALYDVGTNGRPGKLIQDFGGLGTANTAFASATGILSAALTNSLWLPPGIYYAAIQAIWTVGGTGTPGLNTQSQWIPPLLGSGATRGNVMATANGGSAAFADPAAATTGWAFYPQSSGNPFFFGFQ